jgi:F-type H+-transporting ATPase subunit b
MVSLDWSIIPAIIIFLLLIFALNCLLFKPLQKIQAERESRTSGLMGEARARMSHQLDLMNEYQATIKNARMESYRRQEQLRNEAMKKRAEVLAKARTAGEQMIQDSRTSILSQVEAAKKQLDQEAQELARSITSAILGRSALNADPHRP